MNVIWLDLIVDNGTTQRPGVNSIHIKYELSPYILNL